MNFKQTMKVSGAFATALMLSTSAQAQRQVATDGVDVGDCAAASCLTLQYALTQALSGETISLGEGVHDATSLTSAMDVDGVNIEGQGSDVTFLAPTGVTPGILNYGSQSGDLRLEGLTITNATGPAVNFEPAFELAADQSPLPWNMILDDVSFDDGADANNGTGVHVFGEGAFYLTVMGSRLNGQDNRGLDVDWYDGEIGITIENTSLSENGGDGFFFEAVESDASQIVDAWVSTLNIDAVGNGNSGFSIENDAYNSNLWVNLEATSSHANNNNGVYVLSDNGNPLQSTQIDLQDVSVVGNNSSGLYLDSYQGLMNAHIDGLVSRNNGEGIYLYTEYSRLDAVIENSTISNNSSANIEISAYSANANDIEIRDNLIVDGGDEGVYSYGYFSGGTKVLIAGNTISGNDGEGVLWYQTSYGLASDLQVHNNVISDNGEEGVSLIKEEYAASNATIGNNTITGNALSGIYIYNTSSSYGGSWAKIHNNVIADNSGDGIEIYNEEGGIIVDVTNNLIRDNDGNGIDYSWSASYNGALIDITNNTFVDNADYSIRIDEDNGYPAPPIKAEGNWFDDDETMAAQIYDGADGTGTFNFSGPAIDGETITFDFPGGSQTYEFDTDATATFIAVDITLGLTAADSAAALFAALEANYTGTELEFSYTALNSTIEVTANDILPLIWWGSASTFSIDLERSDVPYVYASPHVANLNFSLSAIAGPEFGNNIVALSTAPDEAPFVLSTAPVEITRALGTLIFAGIPADDATLQIAGVTYYFAADGLCEGDVVCIDTSNIGSNIELSDLFGAFYRQASVTLERVEEADFELRTRPLLNGNDTVLSTTDATNIVLTAFTGGGVESHGFGGSIMFDGAMAQVVAVSPDQHRVWVSVPAHAPGAVDVVVTNFGGQTGVLASGYTYNDMIGGHDDDADGVMAEIDNCPDVANADQADIDADGAGDACDPDDDGDGALDDADNCPSISNANQENHDSDDDGDVCDADDDDDGIDDENDNCPHVPNNNQANDDGDLLGDACDIDADGDGTIDREQAGSSPGDSDGDGVNDDVDVCPNVADATQGDLDEDGIGDACDLDADGNGTLDTEDAAAEAVKGVADIQPDSGCSASGGSWWMALVMLPLFIRRRRR